jgi:5-methyltetrahydrofolate--homocysteine methyltransferase
MTVLTDRLANRPYLVFDGAMGTMLQAAGIEPGGAGELWNVDNADAVQAIHAAYLAAGADIVTTNTFGGSRPRLDMHGAGDRVHELNKAAAQLAKKAAEPHGALVAGDIGPSGELLEPLGLLTPDEAQAIFEEQIAGLVDGGIDLILIETMSDLEEVGAAVRASRAVAPELPIVVTLSFDTKLRTMMGVNPAMAVTEIGALGVDAVGANCGRGPEEMQTIMEQMVAVRPEGLLLIGQSNAGLPHLVGDQFEYDADPATMASHAQTLRGLGIDIIGGCCGSTPEHIVAMATALESTN